MDSQESLEINLISGDLDCSGKVKPLKQGFSSQPETEVGLQQWSATRALTLWLCRKEFPQRQRVMKQVKFIRGQRASILYCLKTIAQTKEDNVEQMWYFTMSDNDHRVKRNLASALEKILSLGHISSLGCGHLPLVIAFTHCRCQSQS